MLKRDRPSEYFCGAILRGYDAELATGRVPTPSSIWDHVVIECLRKSDFVTMFRWDTSTAKNKNRIKDIMDAIERGYVPGIELAEDKKGRVVVVPRSG